MIEYSSVQDSSIEDSTIQDSSIQVTTIDNNLGVPSENDLSENDLSENDPSNNELTNNVVLSQDFGVSADQSEDFGISAGQSEEFGLSVGPDLGISVGPDLGISVGPDLGISVGPDLGLIQILETLSSIDELPTTDVVAGSTYIIDGTIWINSNTGWVDITSLELDVVSSGELNDSCSTDDMQFLSLDEILALPDTDTVDESLSFWTVETVPTISADAYKDSPDDALYVAPIRNVTTIASEMKPMSYKYDTSEIFYDSNTGGGSTGPQGPAGITGTSSVVTGPTGASMLGPTGEVGRIDGTGPTGARGTAAARGCFFGDYLYWGSDSWQVGSQNIVLGRKSVFTAQGANAIAIGENSGQDSQNVAAIAVGFGAGQTNQLANAIAIGFSAGASQQQMNAIAIGSDAGEFGQGANAVAIGFSAGQVGQGSGAIALGAYAGQTNQGTNAITIANANVYGLDPLLNPVNPVSWTPVANSQTTLLGGFSSVNSIAYGQNSVGNPLWVAGGYGTTNIFAYSSNGTSWTAVANSQTTAFGNAVQVQTVAYGQDGAGNRLWVAGCLTSTTSILAYSSNGMTGWTAVSGSKNTIFGGDASVYSLAYGQDGAGNRLWVAGASGYAGSPVNSILAYSSNGTSWTGVVSSQTTLFGGNSQVFAVAYGQDGAGNRLWVAGAKGDIATLAYSSNGTSWTRISGSTSLFGGFQVQVYALAYGQDGEGNRLWVAGGTGTDNALAYSSNGITGWTVIPGSKTALFGGNSIVRSVAYGQDASGNRLWVAGASAGAGGAATLAYSTNGITGWTAVPNSQNTVFGVGAVVKSVAFGQNASGNAVWVAGAQSAFSAILAYNDSSSITIPLVIQGASLNQSQNAIAIGRNAGAYTQGESAIAIGVQAGQTNQGSAAIAIGFAAGAIGQGAAAIAIGQGAGQTNQSLNAIALGQGAGQTNQGTNAIAIGQSSGSIGQLESAIAIGQGAGQTNQGTNAIAIGQGAGKMNQGQYAIALGKCAGAFGQGMQSVAIGQLAGAFGQGVNSIAIGSSAGQTNQGTNAIALGQGAGQTNQGTNAIAIGSLAGAIGQSDSAIAIGFRAGQSGQQTNAIAIANSGSVQIINPNSWTAVPNSLSIPFGTFPAVKSLAYGQDGSGNRIWVAGSGADTAIFGYSPDGFNWTTIPNSKTVFGGAGQVKSVAYGQDGAGNPLWLAGAGSVLTNCLAYSSNGTSWTAVANSKTALFGPGGNPGVNVVAYGRDSSGNRLWIAGSDGDVILAYSSNGMTGWTPIANSRTTIFGGQNTRVISLGYGKDGAGNGLWVAGSIGTNGPLGTTAILAYSYDGRTNWTAVANSRTNLFGGNAVVQSIKYGKDSLGNPLWIAGASGGTTSCLAYSSNGTNWSAVSNSKTGLFGGDAWVYSVSYSEDFTGSPLWVAGGLGYTYNLAYSYSGITGWNPVPNSKTTLFGRDSIVSSVEYGQDSTNNPLLIASTDYTSGLTAILGYTSLGGQTFGSLNQGLNAIAIGQGAGQINQSANAVAIGQSAGQMTQQQNAVAIGQQSGQTLQGTNAIAIGLNAGQISQNLSAVAIGQGAGQTLQGNSAVAIGQGAGQTNQVTNAIAIGFSAGASGQTINAVAIGQGAGQTNQGTYAVAIGQGAGQTNQRTNSVAIGFLAGASGQGFSAVAIGQQSGQTNQGTNAIAIGLRAGQTNQVTNAVAIGFQAGATGQKLAAIAIGLNAGFTNQGTNSIAIGANAGQTNLGQFSISIGSSSNVVDSYSIAIGFNAGSTQSSGSRSSSIGANSKGGIGFGAQAGSIRGQTNGIGVGGFYGIGGGYGIGANSGMGNTFSVAIGYNNGFTNAVNAAAIGFQAGQVRQQSGAIAIGFQAGQTNQGANALAIGFKAGQVAQGSGAIAIGFQTGQFSQGQFAFAIGNQVGQISQGQYAVAIGNKAGAFRQGTGAITIASSSGVDEPETSSGSWNTNNSYAFLGTAGTIDIYSIKYGKDGAGNGLWVIGAYGGLACIAYSYDGLSWVSTAAQTTFTGGSTSFRAVAYGKDSTGNGLWVAGNGGTGRSIAYSSNGTNWTSISGSDGLLSNFGTNIYSVAYGKNGAGNGLWLAGGMGPGTTYSLAYSLNGMNNWTNTNLALGTVQTIEFGQDGTGNNIWILGNNSQLLYSTNGITGWTAITGSSGAKSLAYGQDSAGNRLWVAVGSGGIAYSSLGTSGWSTVSNSLVLGIGFNSVSYGRDSFGTRLWVAAGSGATNSLAYSSNGKTGWTAIQNSASLLGTGSYLRSVAYGVNSAGNGLWVGAGYGGSVVMVYSSSFFVSQMSSAFGQGQSAISIGYHAGQVTQGTAAVAIGFQAGQTAQGQNAVAIGSQAGQDRQGTSAVAIGFQAGFTNQGTRAIAIGYQMGQTNQPENSIDIGFQSGFTNQRSAAIAIGFNAGFFGQGTNSVAIGLNAGFTNQGPNAVAIGVEAGEFNQGTNAVAVGFQVGQTNQGQGAVALGYSDIDSLDQLYNSSSTGGFNQGFNAVAVGLYAGNYFQRSGAIALGYQAGQTNQGTNAVAIGFQSGLVNQGTNAIAIGYQIGQTNQLQNTINIGFDVGEVGQGTSAIAIGAQAGQVSQGASAIAIGFTAGQTNQATNAIALGFDAGSINQVVSAIALGAFAGQTNQQTNAIAIGIGAGAFGQQVNAIAIGFSAGQTNQATNAIAIGFSAGQTNQGTNSIAIGRGAGAFGQGSGAIALGTFAGQTNQGTNAITIANATAYNLDPIYTPNPTIWTPVASSQTTIFGGNSSVYAVGFGQDGAGNRLWVAGGFGTNAVLAYSYNGTTWTAVASSQNSLFGGTTSTVTSVAYGEDGAGNRLWVAGAGGTLRALAYSYNGTNWIAISGSKTALFGGNAEVSSVAYGQDSAGNRLWVAGSQGDNATLAYSSDGTNWTPISGSKTALFGGAFCGVLSVAYGQDSGGNRLWVAGANAFSTTAILAYSSNGITGWTPIANSKTNLFGANAGINSVSFGKDETGNGLWVAGATSAAGVAVLAYSSVGTTNWTAITGSKTNLFGGNARVNSVKYGESGANASGRLWVAGAVGTTSILAYSSNGTGWTAVANSQTTIFGGNSVAWSLGYGENTLGYPLWIAGGNGTNAIFASSVSSQTIPFAMIGVGENQGENAIAIGQGAGAYTQAVNAIAIGVQAGQTNQGTNAIAIGFGAGAFNQLQNTIAIGSNAGAFGQYDNAIAIGLGAGQTNQQTNAVAIGFSAGQTNQSQNAVAIGFNAGAFGQSESAIAIGLNSGQTGQATNAIAIGFSAGQTLQMQNAVAIGFNAGAFGQSESAIAIGFRAGQTSQQTNAIAIANSGTVALMTPDAWYPVTNSQTTIFGGSSTVYSVAYGQDGSGNQLWVAGAYGTGASGNTATLAYSSNGMTGWTAVSGSKTALFGGDAIVNAVAYGQDGSGNRLWVAGGNSIAGTGGTATLAYSSNGITGWTAVANSLTTLWGGAGSAKSVAYGQDGAGNRLWVAGGGSGTVRLAYSYDGRTNWTAVANSTSLFDYFGVYSIAYGQDGAGNRLWVAGSYGSTVTLSYSYNGTNWTAVADSKTTLFGGDARVNSVAYGQDSAGNRLWVAGSTGSTNCLAYSPDGTNWTPITNSRNTLFGITIFSVAYGQDGFGKRLWIAGGFGGANILAYSYDGRTGWTAASVPNTLFGGSSQLYSVVYGLDSAGNPLWLSGGNGTTSVFAYSNNTPQFLGSLNQSENAVAIGQGAGQIGQGTNAIAIGLNAGQLTQATNAVAIGLNAGQSRQLQNAVAIGQNAGQFGQSDSAIAIGQGAGQTNQSTNAIAIANSGTVVLINPQTWTAVLNSKTTLFGSSQVYSVAYGQDGSGNRLWVAGAFGPNATLAYSSNGLGWTPVAGSQTTLFGGSSTVNSVAYGQDGAGNRLWVAGADGDTNCMAYSSNGTSWTPMSVSKTTLFGGNARVISVAYGQDGAGNRLWVVGAGAITGSITTVLAYSSNGITGWTAIADSKTVLFGGDAVVRSVAYGQDGAGNRLWVAGSSGTTAVLAYSNNGMTGWTPVANSQTTIFGSSGSGQVYSVAFGQDGAGNRLWVAGAAFATTSCLAYSSNGMTGWTPVANSKTTLFGGDAQVRAVRYGQDDAGNRLWVAGSTGSTATLAYSSNGMTGWTAVANSKTTLFGGSASVNSVAYGQNSSGLPFWLAGGNGSTSVLAYSNSFAQPVGSANQGQNAVAIGQGAGLFSQGANAVALGFNAGFSGQLTNAIAIANSGSVVSPINPKNWTVVTNTKDQLFGTNSTVNSVAYGQDSAGNRLWVAGAFSASTGILAYSSNGMTGWTASSASKTALFGGDSQVNSVAFGQDGAGNRLWVAGAQHFGVGTDILAYSRNGITGWTTISGSKTTLFGGDARVQTVAYGQDGAGNRLWVAGAFTSTGTAILAYSSNGMTGWTAVANSKTNLFGAFGTVLSVGYGQDGAGNRLWVAGGNGVNAVLSYSSNGITGWTPVAGSVTNLFGGGASVNSVAYGQDGAGNRLWVAAAQASSGTATLAYSSNGMTGWTAVANSKTLLWGGDNPASSVAYGQDSSGNRLWVAGSGGTTNVLAYSSNGMTGWTAVPNSQTTLFGANSRVQSVAFGQDSLGNPLFVSGSNGSIGILAYNESLVTVFNSANQGVNAVAIGRFSGSTNQGTNAIAIGFSAGRTSQGANSIALNASSAELSATNPNSFYIRPIRSQAAASDLSVLMYDTVTDELIRSSDTTAAGNKTFVIDHPDDAKKYLVHSCLEGPETGVFYRGTGQIVNGSSCVVSLPSYVDSLATHFTVQLTSVYDGSTNPKLRCSPVKNNCFTVYGSRNCQFFWCVYGRRGEVEVEPLKSDTDVQGVGPYKYV